jgi:glutamate synthase (NADPH/NADH) small chain
MGFIGPEANALVRELNVEINQRGNIERDLNWMSTKQGVFVAGDAGRGQSLIVWAIAEGRSCAASVDSWLQGGSQLPDPITPDLQQLR